MTKRVAVYARVSTARQADNDISIPDQLAQARRFCDGRGWLVVQEFIDAGASARDDKRPELQHMIDVACTDPSPFDVVLVHSQSRFFRDTAGYVVYKRRLEKHGVSLVSMTQDFGVGPSAEFAETIIAAADALSSAENSKHTSRTMLENARQGFWNGAVPPFGYRTVEAEKRGQKIKKRLEIDEREAATVRQIYKLFLDGDGVKGSLGIKDITSWLNRNGFCNKRGKPFFTSCVHRILTRRTYAGLHHYNRINVRLQKERPAEEWVAVKVPAIVSEAAFERVQALLHRRRSDITAPRLTTSDILLTGLAHCEGCGAPLMLNTGKSGRYRYYGCSTKRLKGKHACPNPISIPMAELDKLVLKALADQLITPDRLTTLLRAALRHRRDMASRSHAARQALKVDRRNIEAQIERLLAAVADGTVPDMGLIRPKLGELKERQEEVRRHLALLDQDLPELRHSLTGQQARSVAATLKRRLLDAPKAIQRRYVRGLVTKVVVNGEVAVISGSEAALATVASNPDRLATVPTFVPTWCALGESNPSCRNENPES